MAPVMLPHGTSVPAEISTINPQVVFIARELQANKIPKINKKILIN
jgi:hypothetical protein